MALSFVSLSSFKNPEVKGHIVSDTGTTVLRVSVLVCSYRLVESYRGMWQLVKLLGIVLQQNTSRPLRSKGARMTLSRVQLTLLMSRWAPLPISTTVSSHVIVLTPAFVTPIFVEEILSASSVMVVRAAIAVALLTVRVPLLTTIMSISYVGMRTLSDFTLGCCWILAPLGACGLVKRMIVGLGLNWWGKSWLIQVWRTKFPTIWHLSQNTVHHCLSLKIFWSWERSLNYLCWRGHVIHSSFIPARRCGGRAWISNKMLGVWQTDILWCMATSGSKLNFDWPSKKFYSIK